MARKKEVILKGNPLLSGAVKVAEGYNFTVRVPEGAEATLLLYKKKGKNPVKEICLTDEYRDGEICSILLPDFQAEKYEYNYRIDGKVSQDPYAKRICGRDTFGHVPTESEHEIRCGFLAEEEFDWENDKPVKLAYKDMILYKLHVRGYTKKAKVASKMRGTFAGLQEMIPYLKELGINAVELMPAYDFAEIEIPKKMTAYVQEKNVSKNINYWGYLPGFYFAPKRSYCASDAPENEMRTLVKALHQAGIACVMEMYFPKDISPMYVLQVLHYWKLFYHVDGFHLLGDGVPKNLIIQDDLLKGTKLMAEWFSDDEVALDHGKGKILADYNMKFLVNMRRFLKSDAGISWNAASCVKENFSKKSVVNFMACHDGFTMNDMVTYNEKHNESNGHENLDGSDYNFSWNCGEEGNTTKKAIHAFREKQLRNAFLMLLLSQGIPMIYAGDEFGNSQGGNNNAYCQDNQTGWVDWNGLKKNEGMWHFVKDAIAFRKAHPVLHMDGAMQERDYLMKGLPDLSFHGSSAWDCRFDDYNRLFGMMYCGAYASREDGNADDMIYVGYNFHWSSKELALPDPGHGKVWKKVMDTSVLSGKGCFVESEELYEKKIEMEPRTIIVLVGNRGMEK